MDYSSKCALARIMDYVRGACRDADEPDGIDALHRHPIGYLYSFAIWAVDAEVSNGGFEQLMDSSTKKALRPAVAGYRRLGYHVISEVLQAAIDLSGTNDSESSLTNTNVDGNTYPSLSQLLGQSRKTKWDSLDDAYWREKQRLPGFSSADETLDFLFDYYWHTFPGDFEDGSSEESAGKH